MDAHAARLTRRRALAGVVTALALGGAVALVVALQASPRSASSHSPALPSAYAPLVVKPTMGAHGLTSINVTVESRSKGASLQIQVLRSDASGAAQAVQQSPADQQVVYQQQVPMTDIASPASGAPSTVARASWSGVLSPTNWTGGCQNSLYRIVAEVADSSGMRSSSPAPVHTFKGQWFHCSRTGRGATGGRIGHRTGYFDEDDR